MNNLTKEQMQEDIDFLRKRAAKCGAYLRPRTFAGRSSNAIVNLAYGGRYPRRNEMPYDQADLAACERAVKQLPAHRVTPKVIRALERARKAVEDREKKLERKLAKEIKLAKERAEAKVSASA